MTCRRLRVGVLFFCMLVLGCLWDCQKVSAEEIGQLPEGDILIVYSDDASVAEQDQMMLLVENLTYQNYQVTFAPASDCVGNLDQFKSIICYKVERYPTELVWELYERENRDIRILFMGNQFLQDYLMQTGRSGHYQKLNTQVARLGYAFSVSRQIEALIREDSFVFLKNTDDTTGELEAAGVDGYFYAENGVLSHIPLTDLEEPLVRAASFREISQWLWREAYPAGTYAQYIVLNQVYPFQNPDRLLTVVQKLVERELPFIITVMPLYEHGDYPAMDRFCEVLRYAQANGAMIMIHTPINQMPQFDAKRVNEALTEAIDIYLQHDVYPIGLQVPRSWMFREDTLGVMERYRTILVDQSSDRLIYSDVVLNSNAMYIKGHQWIAPTVVLDTEGTSYLTNYSSAVYFDIAEEEEEIDKRLKACMESETPFKNIWTVDHEVRTDRDERLYQNGYLTINGELKKLVYEPGEEQEEFAYNRNVLARVSRDLTSQNRKLLVAVLAVSVLFVGFIFIARYRNRRRFFFPVSDNPWEGLDDEALGEVLEQQLREREEQERKEQEREEQEDDLEFWDLSETDDYDIRELHGKDNYDIRQLSGEDDYDITEISEKDDYEYRL